MTNESKPLVQPRRLLTLLLCCTAFFVAADFVRLIARFGLNAPWFSRSGSLFSIGGEHNLPTWFSSIQLAFAAFLALLIFRDRRSESDRFAFFWGLLGLVMLYVSLDEAVCLHERLSLPLRSTFGFGGVLYYAWLVPGITLTVAFAIGSLPFLRALPRRTAGILMTAGLIFLLGAAGVEMAEGWLADSGNNRSLLFALLVTLEEALEMSGVALFIYGVADYAAAHCERVGQLFR